MKGIFKALGAGLGYGIGMAGWVGVFAAGTLYGKYQAYKKAETDPEWFEEMGKAHDAVNDSGDNIMKEMGVL